MNIPEIIVDNFRFDNIDSMRYWSHPKSYDQKKKREESKYMCLSGDYYGSRKMDGAWNMLIRDLDGNFHLRSRTESVNGGFSDKAEWIPHICKDLENIPNGTILLGEIYFPNNEGSRKITSVLNCLKDKCLERQRKNGYLHYYVFDKRVWERIKLIKDCQKYIAKLFNKGHTIIFLTSTEPENLKKKANWLQRNFPYINIRKSLFCCPKKQYMSGIDLLIDDCGSNLIDAKYNGIILDYPWNQDFVTDDKQFFRANNWKEIYEIVCSLSSL